MRRIALVLALLMTACGPPDTGTPDCGPCGTYVPRDPSAPPGPPGACIIDPMSCR